MDFPVFMAGFSLGLSLIVAIGAQNVFVLRQGLRGHHVFAVCLACALSDSILIVCGVSGFGTLSGKYPWLEPLMRYGGALFLIVYGARSLWSAFRSKEVLSVGGEVERRDFTRTLLACLAITWLNPHVYLDTVVLLGAVSTRFPGGQVSFAAGAITGSFLFFFSLGYGAAWLRPLFAKPGAWRVIEGGIALVMWALAAKLLAGM